MLWLNLLVWICFSTLSSTSVLARSSRLCSPLIGCILHCFGYLSSVVLGLLRCCGWAAVVAVARHMLLIRALLHTLGSSLRLAWIQWVPTISRMLCSLALDDLKLFFCQHRCNAYEMIRLGYPRVMGCTLSMFLA
jgi:hypothetical protein